MSRRQCAKCPWKVDVDPRDIPDGYSEELHRSLSCTIAGPGALPLDEVRAMACHQSHPGKEIICAGWLANQIGPGGNVALRLAAAFGSVDGDVEIVGKQHERFEDTLPRRKRKAWEEKQ